MRLIFFGQRILLTVVAVEPVDLLLNGKQMFKGLIWVKLDRTDAKFFTVLTSLPFASILFIQ
jgi:hypothetical protein